MEASLLFYRMSCCLIEQFNFISKRLGTINIFVNNVMLYNCNVYSCNTKPYNDELE